MSQVIFQLITDDVAHPENLVNRLIIAVTKPKDNPATRWPVHVRVWFQLPDETFEDTVWWPHSGMRVSYSELPCDIKLALKDETGIDVIAGIECAIDAINSRAWYGFLSLAFDLVLIPTRRFWQWVYRRTGRTLFNGGRDVVCSTAADRISKALGVDLFHDRAPSLITPADFLSCKLLATL